MRNGKWETTKEKARKRLASLRETHNPRCRCWTLTYPRRNAYPRYYLGIQLPDYIQSQVETGFIAAKQWRM